MGRLGCNHGRGDWSRHRLVEDLRKKWASMAAYFQSLERVGLERPIQTGKNFRYPDQFGAHIAQAVSYMDLAENNIRANLNDQASRWNIARQGIDHRLTVEGMHLYINRILLVVEFMKEKSFDDEGFIVDAWWTTIFRGICWHRSVCNRPNSKNADVPSSLHGSSIPVYIA